MGEGERVIHAMVTEFHTSCDILKKTCRGKYLFTSYF